MDTITLVTDGACSGNPGPGGWCVIVKKENEIKEFFGGELKTTNNKMELTAVIKGFENIDSYSNVTVKTDSTYVINGITKWLANWKKKGWINAAKKPVANKDLWVELDVLCSNMNMKWKWVKAHDGDPGNERADYLANLGADCVS